ncbi:MAG: DNA repair protein RadC [Alphaproteobacteria bacterium]|nr:DNA repair protein RadC [Alphaproteobacteria bacterium]
MTEETAEKPLYLGHRARLKERFMVDEGASMPDYELLELLLTMAIPRRDVKPLAKKLIATFGDLVSVIKTPAHELLEQSELSPNAIVLLKAVSTCLLRATGRILGEPDKNVISCWDEFYDYCRQLIGYKDVEEFHVFFFNDNLCYKGDMLLSVGTVNKAYVYPREILRKAIEVKASFIILAHNHPSGNVKPSSADIKLTKDICELCDLMELKVFDHIIVSKYNIYSFKSSGNIQSFNAGPFHIKNNV